ncbi:hypothetical protein HMPREF1318_1253 [Actinomyces massiliensis F0489]|uniref:Uncharacterized protein n=1 Tax=Actinomyces massiliensis F0489 TaxID=1125718 RepID=J0WGL9_9ACTO|nr:hypothetical protein HMPREF1318_1253 [Actinomyces massiliensis F0489]
MPRDEPSSRLTFWDEIDDATVDLIPKSQSRRMKRMRGSHMLLLTERSLSAH